MSSYGESSSSRGPPLFKGDTLTRGPWITFEFKYRAYVRAKQCAAPLTENRPGLPAPNMNVAARDRRMEEIEKWDEQNSRAYGYLVQAMEENVEALTALQLKERQDLVNGTNARECLQHLREKYQPESELETENVRRMWSAVKLQRFESLVTLFERLTMLQSMLASSGAPTTEAQNKMRFIEALQNGEATIGIVMVRGD